MPTYPGDPLTPGIGATKGAKRLPISEAATLTKIPVLPISYGDAQPLLAALGGHLAPSSWRGALPLTYRVGPGEARVHLVVRSDWSLKTLHDVIARMPGTTDADQWVIRGNHHDAWVNGAEDPISGLVAVMEEARALGELRKQGWRPKRTIIYAAWDGEEPGLIGSTEWAEAHAAELVAHAAAYVNSDANGRGYLSVGGSHSLEHFVNGVEKDIVDPESHVSSWRRARAARELSGDADGVAGDDSRIAALGSGSDYTPFLQHLGVATLNLGYGGEDRGGIYHSAYDDFYWFTHFSDTSFVYGRALAQAAGTAVMRLAFADVLPFVFTNLAVTTGRYAKELDSLRDRRAKDIALRTRRLEDSTFIVASDPRRPLRPPPPQAAPPRFDFAPLLDAQDSLAKAAARFETSYSAWSTRPTRAGDGATLRRVNVTLMQAERALLAEAGLRNRPWYKHLLYAPGYYTGYGVKTMPGVREAIEEGKWSDVNSEIVRLAEALRRETALVNDAARLLGAER
jgi:N-acetylated-alpha-linked acidic dipeptidase